MSNSNPYEYIDYSRQTASNMRVCLVCKRPIVELRKASYLEAGNGLRLVAHDACLDALNEAVNEKREQEEYREAVDTFTHAVASGIVRRLEDVHTH